MDIQESLEKIYSLHQFSIKLGLESITNLMNHLGNPQNNLKCFHIAGSNGKGSTASFIASILREAGFKTGLYTSPHFVKFNERIRINGEMINDDFIADFLKNNHNYIVNNSVTFFEITTALAFEYFNSEKVDYAVIETGLGGRLDATNIINPIASVITTISLEHQNILGNTIEQIAKEKAGIIKQNGNIFTGLLQEKAFDVIKKISFDKSADLYNLSNYIYEKDNNVILKNIISEFRINNLPLYGNHQKINAALAVLSLNKELNFNNENILRKGLQNVIENTGIQGRYEIFYKYPRVIFDSCHNEEGVTVFLDEFKNEFFNYDKCYLIFGAMKDKNIRSMMILLKEYFSEILFTRIDNKRALNYKEFLELTDNLNLKSSIEENPDKVISNFIKTGKNECLVVLGSIYMLGSIKEKLILKDFT
ncbi:MAG: bifunctional folylpolyglutamate synthase/dihydrofolate synthase [Ignavibacteria bacterium]|nr:bifunctional folylpolyglutamate synthase/dihydrofolate synthase [Ignavibacteria bacterium]